MKKKFFVLILALCGVLAVFVTACEKESGGSKMRKCKCWYSSPDIDRYAGIYEVEASKSCSSLNVPGTNTRYSFYCNNAN